MHSTRSIPTVRGLMAGAALTALMATSACSQMDGMQTAMAGDSMSDTVMVGGAPMYPTKDIVDNAVNSEAHTTLVAAVQAADLVDTLKSPGPFTVFAPTNAAFDMLPAGTVDTLLQPENKPMLEHVLTYHVVPGRISSEDLQRMIEAGGGSAMLETASGDTLVAMANGPRNVVIEDESGNTAEISTYDVNQSNGVIHVVDTVLLPAM